jgi:hypothetical protein
MKDNDLNEVKNLNKVKKTNPVEGQSDKNASDVGIEDEEMDLEDETSDADETIGTVGQGQVGQSRNSEFTEGKRGV